MRYLILATHPSMIPWGEVERKKDLIQNPTWGRGVGVDSPGRRLRRSITLGCRGREAPIKI